MRLLAVASLVLPHGSNAQNAGTYPNKPIRIITGPVGGGNDIAARLIAESASGPLGQPVIVENRAGLIAVEAVAKAQPDGYTLLIYGGPVWLQPFLRDHVAWDPLADFAPVALASGAPNVLVVHPSVAAASVKELIALARSAPRKLNYASGEAGAANHLAAELFKSMAGIDLVRIAYKATGVAVSDLLAGQVQVMFVNAGPLAPHAKSGRIKLLAVTSAQPSMLFPELPTVAASGLPGYESVARTGIFAPARTPAPIISRLNREFVAYLKTAAARERFFSSGAEPVGGAPEELTRMMKSEMARMGKLIKDLGIRAE